MRFNEIYEEREKSIYTKDYEKFKPFIELGQKISNSTEIGSGVDWKGEDDLWNKASTVGSALVHLGKGKVQNPKDALKLANITSTEEWEKIVAKANQADKADFDGGDEEDSKDEL